VPAEPSPKRAIAFFDGQNLFHAARAAFGYSHPSFDPRSLAEAVCRGQGVDVRLALDVVRLTHRRAYDVGLISSQDQDLSEAAEEVRVIAREQARWVKLASAFPSSPTARNTRGINKTDWIRVDRATYCACLDPRDYRPKAQTP